MSGEDPNPTPSGLPSHGWKPAGGPPEQPPVTRIWAPPTGPAGWPPAPAEPGSAGWVPQLPPPADRGAPPAGTPYAGERSPRRRSGGSRPGPLIGLVAAATVLGGGGVFGLNAYAERTVCAALRSDDSRPVAGDPATGGTATELRATAGRLHSYARMLVLDRDLHRAVDSLADDLDRWAALTQKKAGVSNPADPATASIGAVAGSVDTHVKAARKACGRPATGIVGK